jgi:hypothetical protein
MDHQNEHFGLNEKIIRTITSCRFRQSATKLRHQEFTLGAAHQITLAIFSNIALPVVNREVINVRLR